jgi:hypothetical protein
MPLDLDAARKLVTDPWCAALRSQRTIHNN